MTAIVRTDHMAVTITPICPIPPPKTSHRERGHRCPHHRPFHYHISLQFNIAFMTYAVGTREVCGTTSSPLVQDHLCQHRFYYRRQVNHRINVSPSPLLPLPRSSRGHRTLCARVCVSTLTSATRQETCVHARVKQGRFLCTCI